MVVVDDTVLNISVYPFMNGLAINSLCRRRHFSNRFVILCVCVCIWSIGNQSPYSRNGGFSNDVGWHICFLLNYNWRPFNNSKIIAANATDRDDDDDDNVNDNNCKMNNSIHHSNTNRNNWFCMYQTNFSATSQQNHTVKSLVIVISLTNRWLRKISIFFNIVFGLKSYFYFIELGKHRKAMCADDVLMWNGCYVHKWTGGSIWQVLQNILEILWGKPLQ